MHNVELNYATLVELAISMFINAFISHKYVKHVAKFVTTKSILPFTTLPYEQVQNLYFVITKYL